MAFAQHIVVSVVRNGEDMWGHFRLSFAFVAADNVVVIDREPFVRIDGDTEKT